MPNAMPCHIRPTYLKDIIIPYYLPTYLLHFAAFFIYFFICFLFVRFVLFWLYFDSDWISTRIDTQAIKATKINTILLTI